MKAPPRMPVWRRALMGAMGSAALGAAGWLVVDLLFFADVVPSKLVLGAGLLGAVGVFALRDMFTG